MSITLKKGAVHRLEQVQRFSFCSSFNAVRIRYSIYDTAPFCGRLGRISSQIGVDMREGEESREVLGCGLEGQRRRGPGEDTGRFRGA